MSDKIQPSQSAAATAIAVAWDIVSKTQSDKTDETAKPLEPRTAAQKSAAKAKQINELTLKILAGIPLVQS